MRRKWTVGIIVGAFLLGLLGLVIYQSRAAYEIYETVLVDVRENHLAVWRIDDENLYYVQPHSDGVYLDDRGQRIDPSELRPGQQFLIYEKNPQDNLVYPGTIYASRIKLLDPSESPHYPEALAAYNLIRTLPMRISYVSGGELRTDDCWVVNDIHYIVEEWRIKCRIKAEITVEDYHRVIEAFGEEIVADGGAAVGYIPDNKYSIDVKLSEDFLPEIEESQELYLQSLMMTIAGSERGVGSAVVTVTVGDALRFEYSVDL